MLKSTHARHEFRLSPLPIAALLSLLFLSLTAALPAQIYSGEFGGANNRRPDNWQAHNATEGSHWFQRDGEFVSGDPAGTPAPGPTFAVVNESALDETRDYRAEVDFWMSASSGTIMVLGRWRDAGTHYAAILEASGGGARSAKIERILRGRRTVLASRDAGVPSFTENVRPNPPVRLGLEMVGNQLGMYVNGTRVLEATDDLPLRNGTAGLGVDGSVVLFDRFRVERAGGQQTTVAAARGEAVATPAPAGTFFPGLPVPGSPTPAPAPAPTPAAAPAPGPVLGVSPGAQDADQSYRVRVGSYSTLPQAMNVVNQLTTDLGYWNARPQQEDGGVSVFIETQSRSSADNLVMSLRSEGFTQASVVAGTVGPRGQTLPEYVQQTQTFQQLPESERRRILEISTSENFADVIANLSTRTDVSPELQRQYERLADELTTVRSAIENQQAVERSREEAREELIALREQFQTKLQLDDFEGARNIISEMRRIDPDSNLILLVEADLRRRMEGQRRDTELRQKLATYVEDAREAEAEGDLDTALQMWTSVRAFPEQQLVTPELQNEMAAAMRRLNTAKNEAQARLTTSVGWLEQWMYYIVGAVAFLGLVVLVYILTTKRRVKKIMEDQLPEMVLPELLDIQGLGMIGIESGEKRPLALPGGGDSGGGAAGADSRGSSTSSTVRRRARASERTQQLRAREEEQTVPPAGMGAAAGLAPTRPSESKSRSSAPPERPRPSGARAASAARMAGPAPAREGKKEEEIHLEEAPDLSELEGLGAEEEESTGGAGLEERGRPSEDRSPVFDQASAEDSLSDLLQDLPGEEKASPKPEKSRAAPKSTDLEEEPKAAGAAAKVEMPSEDEGEEKPAEAGGIDFGEFGLGETFKIQTGPAESRKKAGVEKAPASEKHAVANEIGPVFEQDFSEVDSGSKPENWDGEFDFAELTVIDASDIGSADGASPPERALQYLKENGAGQVYYACGFPDVRGSAEIEFDICCLEKNRFLLGFYIEKNRDFRRSIHTVVHCASPKAKASIRLQGMPTQYEMGTWSHVLLRLDLSSKKLHGEVDGKVVMDDEFVENMPDMVNTLAIRDNHPTTGKLLIGNIKVRKTA